MTSCSESEELKFNIEKPGVYFYKLAGQESIDSLSTDVNIRITELENTIEDKMEKLDDQKMDRKMLGDLLMKLGEKISQ